MAFETCVVNRCHLSHQDAQALDLTCRAVTCCLELAPPPPLLNRPWQISRMYGTHGRETSLIIKNALAYLVSTNGPAERRLVWGAMMADRTSRLKYVLDFHSKHAGQKGFALERVHLMRPIGAPQINPAYPSGRVLHTTLSNFSVDTTTTLPQWHVDAMLTVVMTIKGRHSSLEGLLRTASSLNLAIARIALQFVVSVYNTPEVRVHAPVRAPVHVCLPVCLLVCACVCVCVSVCRCVCLYM
jgi:hypothetical protein